jgi:hypothetical protein
MAEMGRAATHHAALTATPGWGEVDQALGKLDVRTDKDKHLRTEGGQTELHVHDSKNWHGIGSPKAKYKEAVLLIKSAIDKDFGPGAGDTVFRNIGIRKNSAGIQLKDLAALRQEVAKLGTVGSYDQDTLKTTLQSVNKPKIGPEEMDLGKGRTVTVSGQMRREQPHELVDKAAKKHIPTQTDLCDAAAEQMTRIQGHEILIRAWIISHLGDDADPQPQSHIGLDHVCIDRGQGDARAKVGSLEGLIELRAPREAEHVSDNGEVRHFLQGQRGARGQWMIMRYENSAIPFVARQHDQILEQLHRFGRNRHVDQPTRSHLGDLHRRSLLHGQCDPRVAHHELPHHRG